MTLILSGTDGLSDIDGSAATPAIRGTDANTGIFFPAADTIAFSEGGTESMRIDSSGNVGIGTSSPGTRVHASIASATAYTTSSRANVLTVQNTTAGGYAGIEFLSEPSSGNAGIAGINSFAPATGDSVLTFSTRSSSTLAERARIDSSGNLGLGVTPSAWVTLGPAFQLGGGGAFISGRSTNPEVYVGTNAHYNGSNYIYKTSNVASLYAQDTGDHKWYHAPSGTAGNAISFTQAMTLDSSGNLLVGTTSQPVSTYRQVIQYSGNGGQGGIMFNDTDGGQTLEACYFRKDGGQRGYIRVTTSGTTYATVSDYRLKTDVAPMIGALAKVMALNPCTYTWKETNKNGQGFIAHELAEVVPDCVTGEKDAVETYTDEEGNEQTRPKYQGIDTSFLVATLTAAIQEQQALIQSLTARIEALEGK